MNILTVQDKIASFVRKCSFTQMKFILIRCMLQTFSTSLHEKKAVTGTDYVMPHIRFTEEVFFEYSFGIL